MHKRHAFIIAFLITGLIASDLFIFGRLAKGSERESAVVARVIDGDTLKLEDGRTIRLLNINTPEKGVAGAELAKEFLEEYENKTVEIEIIGTDKYLRSLARLYAQDYINLKIVEQGLSSKFLVQDSELKVFADAEASAIKNSKGIWNKSEFFSCFTTDIDEKAETVSINNQCTPINVSGWTLKDESRKTFKFKGLSLGKIRLHSSNGVDNSTDIFWDSKENIWNNDRDSLYLFDEKGRIAHYETYGY